MWRQYSHPPNTQHLALFFFPAALGAYQPPLSRSQLRMLIGTVPDSSLGVVAVGAPPDTPAARTARQWAAVNFANMSVEFVAPDSGKYGSLLGDFEQPVLTFVMWPVGMDIVALAAWGDRIIVVDSTPSVKVGERFVGSE